MGLSFSARVVFSIVLPSVIIYFSAKFQIPKLKSQIISKLQIQMSETILFRFSNFGDWNLFVIWCLEFGASHHGHALCLTSGAVWEDG
jgi:hypothetical protein